MKLLYLLLTLVNCEKFIRNANIPSCKNCIYFKPNVYNTDFTSSSSECTKFGNKDILTDKISFDYADRCRSDKTKCGEEGKYFEAEKNINLKIFKHKFVSNIPNNVFTITILLTFLSIILPKKN
jgi:hypothetical protein